MTASWFCCCGECKCKCDPCKLLKLSGSFCSPCTGNLDIRFNDGVDYYTPSNNTSNDATLTWDGTDYPMNGVDIVTVSVVAGECYPYTLTGTFSADVGIQLFDPVGTLLSGIRPSGPDVDAAEFWCDLSGSVESKSFWYRVVGKLDCCDILTDTHNTGEGLSVGDVDPNWICSPGTDATVVDVTGDAVFSRWPTDGTDVSQFISQAGQTAATTRPPDVPYPTYSTTFTVNSLPATLCFQTESDNCITDISINGTSVFSDSAEECNLSSFGTWRKWNFPADLVGSNTITFTVFDEGDVAGFRLEWCPNDPPGESMGLVGPMPMASVNGDPFGHYVQAVKQALGPRRKCCRKR